MTKRTSVWQRATPERCYGTHASGVNPQNSCRHPRPFQSAAMYEKIQLILVGVFAFVYGFSALARRFPDVAWLQRLRYDPPRLSDAQRAKMRRRANIHAGVELILLGLVIPLCYVALTMMLFSDVTRTAMTIVFAGSALCIGLGLTAIWKSLRE